MKCYKLSLWRLIFCSLVYISLVTQGMPPVHLKIVRKKLTSSPYFYAQLVCWNAIFHRLFVALQQNDELSLHKGQLWERFVSIHYGSSSIKIPLKLRLIVWKAKYKYTDLPRQGVRWTSRFKSSQTMWGEKVWQS